MCAAKYAYWTMSKCYLHVLNVLSGKDMVGFILFVLSQTEQLSLRLLKLIELMMLCKLRGLRRYGVKKLSMQRLLNDDKKCPSICR